MLIVYNKRFTIEKYILFTNFFKVFKKALYYFLWKLYSLLYN